MKEQKILKEIIRSVPNNFYYIDERKGTVYARNELFEAGEGTLYEKVGTLDPKVVTANKKKMSKDHIFFINDKNRKETLYEILASWTPVSE